MFIPSSTSPPPLLSLKGTSLLFGFYTYTLHQHVTSPLPDVIKIKGPQIYLNIVKSTGEVHVESKR